MPLATSITNEHVSRLLMAAASARNPRRDVALVRFAAETGARPVELASLTWRAFVDAAGSLTGRARWQTAKGGKVRDVGLSEPLQQAIATLYARVAGKAPVDSPVFLSERRGAFKAQSMRAHLKAIATRAGLNASGYSLRHMAFDAEARAVAESGGTGATLLAFTGHKSLTSVQHYLDVHDAAVAACDTARAKRVAAY
jgi:integrase